MIVTTGADPELIISLKTPRRHLNQHFVTSHHTPYTGYDVRGAAKLGHHICCNAVDDNLHHLSMSSFHKYKTLLRQAHRNIIIKNRSYCTPKKTSMSRTLYPRYYTIYRRACVKVWFCHCRRSYNDGFFLFFHYIRLRHAKYIYC